MQDELGKEMAPDARLWQEYTREAGEYDANFINEWNRTADIILVFAALFSAILTAFLIESYKMLSPDPQDTTNAFLLGIYDTLRSNSTASPTAPTSDKEEQFSPSTTAVWVNALWFTALTCSLGVSSIAMLIKQWLNAYTTGLASAHQLRARVRQYRYNTLVAWRTHHIINSLPLALSICLMLFLAGLALLLLSLNTRIAIVSIVLIGITLVFHLASLLLPAICNCPWRTALSPVMYRLLHPVRASLNLLVGAAPRIQVKSLRGRLTHVTMKISNSNLLFYVVAILLSPFLLVWRGSKLLWRASVRIVKVYMDRHQLAFVYPTYLQNAAAATSALPTVLAPFFTQLARAAVHLTEMWWRTHSEAETEQLKVGEAAPALDTAAAFWLLHTSTKKTVVDLTAQAIAGLPTDSTAAVQILSRGNALQIIRNRLQACFHGPTLHAPVEAELYARALLRVHSILRVSDHDYGVQSRTDDIKMARALVSVTSSHQSKTTLVTFMCLGAMLHEMVETLERHFEAVAPLPPFHLHILIDTIGQEIAWRKRPKFDHWTSSSSGSFGGLIPRILPILIKLLDVESSSWPNTGEPLPLDTSIAFTIAMFTQGPAAIDMASYMTESQRQRNFYHLILTGLSPILHFPESFGCRDEALQDLIRKKYLAACRSHVRDRTQTSLHDPVALVEILRSSISIGSHPPEDLLLALSQIDKQAMTSLDLSPLVEYVVFLGRNIPVASGFHLLVCFERLADESFKSPALVRSHITRPLVGLINSATLDASTRSQAFRILAKIAYHISESKSLTQMMIDQGLLNTVREFFADPGPLSQGDIDQLVCVMSKLCDQHGQAVAENHVLQAMISWSRRHWKGSELIFPHIITLQAMGAKIGDPIDLAEDTAWLQALPGPKRHLEARAL